MHLGWSGRPEEAVPKHPKVADGSSDRAPRRALTVNGWASWSSISSSLPGAACQPPDRLPVTSCSHRLTVSSACPSRRSVVSSSDVTASPYGGRSSLLNRIPGPGMTRPPNVERQRPGEESPGRKGSAVALDHPARRLPRRPTIDLYAGPDSLAALIRQTEPIARTTIPASVSRSDTCHQRARFTRSCRSVRLRQWIGWSSGPHSNG
jgi:hypothetical protein